MRSSSTPVRTSLAGSILVLAGCTGMSGLDGGSRYACQAPAGVACDSVSGVYANSVARSHATTAVAPLAPAAVQPASPGPGDAPERAAALWPDRAPPRILRLWIRPWEDSDGDLHDQAYIYVQIDSGRWRMDHAQQLLREASVPIRLAPGAAAGASDRGVPAGTMHGPSSLPRAPAASPTVPGSQP